MKNDPSGDSPRTLGERLKFARLRAGLTQRELSEACGKRLVAAVDGDGNPIPHRADEPLPGSISPGQIAKLENGTRVHPRADQLVALAQALVVSVEWLLEGRTDTVDVNFLAGKAKVGEVAEELGIRDPHTIALAKYAMELWLDARASTPVLGVLLHGLRELRTEVLAAQAKYAPPEEK